MRSVMLRKTTKKSIAILLVLTTLVTGCSTQDKSVEEHDLQNIDMLKVQNLSSPSATFELTLLNSDISETLVKLRPSVYNNLKKEYSKSQETQYDIKEYIATYKELMENLRQQKYTSTDRERVKEIAKLVSSMKSSIKDSKITNKEYRGIQDKAERILLKDLMNAQLNASTDRNTVYTSKELADKVVLFTRYPYKELQNLNKKLEYLLNVAIPTNKGVDKSFKDLQKAISQYQEVTDKLKGAYSKYAKDVTMPLHTLKGLSKDKILDNKNKYQDLLNDLEEEYAKNVTSTMTEKKGGVKEESYAYNFGAKPTTDYQEAVSTILSNLQTILMEDVKNDGKNSWNI